LPTDDNNNVIPSMTSIAFDSSGTLYVLSDSYYYTGTPIIYMYSGAGSSKSSSSSSGKSSKMYGLIVLVAVVPIGAAIAAAAKASAAAKAAADSAAKAADEAAKAPKDASAIESNTPDKYGKVEKHSDQNHCCVPRGY